MLKLYFDYKENGKVIHTSHAHTLIEADAKFRQNNPGKEPGILGLHVRQDPKELKQLVEVRAAALQAAG